MPQRALQLNRAPRKGKVAGAPRRGFGRGVALAALVFFLALGAGPVRAEYGDVILNRLSEKEGMRPVIFPHWFHRIRYLCSVCHVQIGFKLKAGADDIDMAKIVDGKYCGACHNGRIAWGPSRCGLCHSGRPGLKTGIRGGDLTEGPGRW